MTRGPSVVLFLTLFLHLHIVKKVDIVDIDRESEQGSESRRLD